MRLAPDVLARIDALVAPGRRADFIREAVEQALARHELLPPAPAAGEAVMKPDPSALYAALTAARKANAGR